MNVKADQKFKSHGKPSDGPQMAVSNTQARLQAGPHHHDLEVSRLHHSDAVRQERPRSDIVTTNMKVTTEKWEIPSSVMTQAAQMSYLPGYLPPTRSKARISPPHGPQVAVISIQLNSLEGECSIGLKKSKLHHSGAVN